MYGRGMTDGLPVIPPTGERVERMMDAVSSPPEHVVAELPPRGGLATIEKLAINSVMAGCRPEYFPVVIAAVEAMTQPQFNLIGVQTTTNPVAPFLLLNGPVRRSLDVNCGAGALGPGRRANATIGRALRLILINIGGGVPGEGDKSILGSPGKYTFCLGELEEESPWEPFHVEHGFAPDESTVTVISSQGTQSCAASFLQPVSILMMLSDAMRAYGANSYTKGNGNPVVILPPAHARLFAGAGWNKRRIKAWLFEHTMIPRSEMPAEPRLLDTTSRQRIENGKVCICAKADDIVVIVAGGSELNHAGFLASFGNDLAIRRIGD
ncbi:MAG: hypothetical protein A3H35_01910 [Betaproteobacteria bacterium RIFCSPLOWO2_02_FULL_62_17]|nr:MAG: hypothetical protein A3H35_01910 [Betaproteobacteria bacterium RIFCSPLOWO2_02_FULL_62_17]